MNGLKRSRPLLMLALTSLVGLTVLAIATAYVLVRQGRATERLNRAISRNHTSNRLADQLRQSSDDLTRMVRTYAATGDSRFEDHFYTILAIRDGEAPRPVQYDRIYWDFKVTQEAEAGTEDGEIAPP